MSAVAGPSQHLQQLLSACTATNSEQDEPKTSSSILEFLSQEQKCWSENNQNLVLDVGQGGSDSASEVDIDGIFDEINRLSGKIHESRSVDEILKEAENLILRQAPIQLKCIDEKWSTSDTTDHGVSEEEVELIEEPHREDRLTPPKNLNLTQINHPVLHSKSESYLSKILSPSNSANNMPSAAPVPSTPLDDIPLPVHPQPASMSSSIYSPTNSYARERALESEITALQDKLKDTEERYHSIRIKYDALRVQYRDIKDQQVSTQDETEKLRLDVKHLNDCASILRSEISVAREERSEAIRLQGVLQSELDTCRGEKKKLAEQTERDSKVILDLQRQCKEMEKILTRKHPDSVSALIVAAKGLPAPAQENATEASRKVLEQRIQQLEKDAVEQDAKAQKILGNVQTKFSAIQAKYETHIADLETQVLSLQEINSTLNKKIVVLADTLEVAKKREQELVEAIESEANERRAKAEVTTRSTQTVTKTSNLPRAVSANSVAGKTQSGGDSDSTHLMATIRGMRVDLAIKEKALQRLTRELDECKKTIKKLKEMSCKIPSNTGTSHKKPYDPMQFTEKSDNNAALKEAHHKLKLLEFDYKALHDKRLQDLKTLQAAHERELTSCQETVRILQQRLAEGDEAQKRRRVPVDYYALKAKVANLEQRHSEREDRLHLLVEALSKGRLNGLIDEAALKAVSSGRESDNGSESTVSPNSD